MKVLKSFRFVILGFMAMAFGFVSVQNTTADAGDLVVSGEVVGFEESRGRRGRTNYSAIVAFVDPSTGSRHTAEEFNSSRSRPVLGSAREVAFAPGTPTSAKVLVDGTTGNLYKLLGFGGGLVFLGSLATKFGLLKLLRGRSSPTDDRAPGGTAPTLAATAESDVPEDPLLAHFRALEAGEAGATVPSADAVLSDVAPQPAPAPPAGSWHPDPSGVPGQLRWWDGAQWTDHVAPAQQAS